MKPHLAAVAALLMLAGCAHRDHAEHTSAPAATPAHDTPIVEDFTVDRVNGFDAFTLSDARGKWVTLHFLLKTECPICLRTTATYASRAGEAPDTLQIFLKPDDPQDTMDWLSKYPPGAKGVPAVYRDPNAQLAERLGIPDGYKFHGEVVHYPALIIIDPQGREVFRKVGTSTFDRMNFDDYLETLNKLRASAG